MYFVLKKVQICMVEDGMLKKMKRHPSCITREDAEAQKS